MTRQVWLQSLEWVGLPTSQPGAASGPEQSHRPDDESGVTQDGVGGGAMQYGLASPGTLPLGHAPASSRGVAMHPYAGYKQTCDAAHVASPHANGCAAVVEASPLPASLAVIPPHDSGDATTTATAQNLLPSIAQPVFPEAESAISRLYQTQRS